MPVAVPEIRVLPSASAAIPLLLDEVRTVLRSERGVLGFATGGTYTAFLRTLADEWRSGRWGAEALRATHLDEYLGFAPDRFGGMVHELGTACPPLLQALAQGSFVPVPHDGTSASLRAHEQRLAAMGGVQVQLLGIGRNGHLAFNEPGTPFDSGFHVTTLAATTRDDARARFLPAEPPTQAVTSGLATILQARRLVLCAFGAAKAPAVRAMLRGEVGPACPASAIRRHGDVLVLLDREAASQLSGDAFAS